MRSWLWSAAMTCCAVREAGRGVEMVVVDIVDRERRDGCLCASALRS